MKLQPLLYLKILIIYATGFTTFKWNNGQKKESGLYSPLFFDEGC